MVPEPAFHVKYFATDTILNYTEDQVGKNKLKEWFIKLLMIRDVAKVRGLKGVLDTAEKMILLSRARWRHKDWAWINSDDYSDSMKRVRFELNS